MRTGLDPHGGRLYRAALVLAIGAGGCDRQPPPSAPPEPPVAATPAPPPEPLAPPEDAGLPAPSLTEPAGPYGGPYFTVTTGSTGIYAEPTADRSRKLGYARNGGRVPVLPGIVPGDGCRAGWYRLLDGGYICSSEGSIDPANPQVRLAVRAPDLNATLPYPYARNAQNGTPLYTSVPTREQIAAYEPWLEPPDPSRVSDPRALPWWQRKEAALSDVRLAELAVESDGLLGRRMVKGFYVAVDTEFEWMERTWYKTTKGLVAPKDRFVAVEGSSFQGVALDAEHGLPVAWVYGSRDTRPTFVEGKTGKLEQSGTVERWKPIHLVGEPREADGHSYLQSTQGFWVRADHVRVAREPPLPLDVQAHEHWIHVNLHTQTLVALAGATPVYATLVSSGRESDDADQDHRTPPGQWNIREKHITTTMDGDGTAAGDLPYSIEDVPYVMYFQGSYALHGAFWHRNYGMRMSHGCINLAPLDAKYLFFFTGPTVREGWHGAWAGNGETGSRVVIEGPVREPTARR
jgi:L,D-transpeptidase-like protein